MSFEADRAAWSAAAPVASGLIFGMVRPTWVGMTTRPDSFDRPAPIGHRHLQPPTAADPSPTGSQAPDRSVRRVVAATVTAVTLLAAGCGATEAARDRGEGDVTAPANLGFVDDQDEVAEGTDPDDRAIATTPPAATPTTGPAPTIWPTSSSTTAPEPIGPGNAARPFTPLPESTRHLAVVSPTGIAMRVLHQRSDGWIAATPCGTVVHLTEGIGVTGAHVVIDPGHGGREIGATGSAGAVEKDLNLEVAQQAKAMLEAAGAEVVLTRSADYTVTVAERGRLAASLGAGLLVSVHHNGGAPPSGDRTGTIVFTKTADTASTRFGGIFHRVLQPVLTEAAETRALDHEVYTQALDGHEIQIDAYDRSVEARDAALVANGQVRPEATTSVPPTTAPVPAGGIRLPSERVLATTTTVAPTATETVPVPETLPLPPPFQLEPVREFVWSGGGNAGVRAWTRPDGADYLGILRNSGSVPAALVEYVYLTNPSEEELVLDPTFVEAEARVLADSVIEFFSDPAAAGTGHVADQTGDQPIGGGGHRSVCSDPELPTR